MLYIISIDSMYTNTTWGGFYMFSFRGVSEFVMHLKEQTGTTIVDSFYINLHEQYLVTWWERAMAGKHDL